MLRWARSRFSHGFAATKILAKGYQIIFPFLQTVSPYQQKIWLDFCLHKVRFPRLNHDILPGCRGQGGVTDRPRCIAIEPMQTEINDTFLFSCKRFIPVSNERVHNFLSNLNFFHRVCLTTLFCVLTVMKTSLTSCESKFAPWLGNALFWFADQTVSKLEKLWTGYSTTNSKLKYITQFSWKNHP